MKSAPAQSPNGRGCKLLVLRTAFNAAIVDGLFDGVREALTEAGVSPAAITTETVPGALELPLAAEVAAGTGSFDAIVAIGAVIRGETDHYEHVARESMRGLVEVSRQTGIPIGIGVLTVTDEAHARARSAPDGDNKGAEAARAALVMVGVLRRLHARRPTPRGRRVRR